VLKKMVWLAVSVLLNALGNALTVKAALGSAPWTAASLNLADTIGMTVGETMIIFGFVVLIADDLLRSHWKIRNDFFNFLYVLTFGYLVDAWLFVMQNLTIDGLILRLIVCVFGVMCIGCALSIYFRVNLVLHPFDDLMKIMRDKYFHGNVVPAQRLSLGIPLTIALTVGLLRHYLVGVNVGTLVSFLCMGYFIELFDKIIKLHLDRKWAMPIHPLRHMHHAHAAHSKA
jgi:uncharacterized membrane protein YczE